jgi:hypothetical protein
MTRNAQALFAIGALTLFAGMPAFATTACSPSMTAGAAPERRVKLLDALEY